MCGEAYFSFPLRAFPRLSLGKEKTPDRRLGGGVQMFQIDNFRASGGHLRRHVLGSSHTSSSGEGVYDQPQEASLRPYILNGREQF